MKVRIDVEGFLKNIESYAEDTDYDYTYYLILNELKRMQISKMIGRLEPEHLNPILLFLRDWMPSGWVMWSEKEERRWQMGLKLCEALNELHTDFSLLNKIDLLHFNHDIHGNAVKRIFEQISDLELAASREAIATVTSKVMHLLNSELFVMCDTRIIASYGFQPNPDGYLEFLVRMKGLAKQLQPYLGRITEKAEKLKKRSSEIYGEQICPVKSLAKLIDESNWIETRKRRVRH